MTEITPTYTKENCRPAYQLNWSLTLFWREKRLLHDWPVRLSAETEKDGVRILKHHVAGPTTDQFLISTRPAVAPKEILYSVKGRAQHLIRDKRPKAFRRNYSFTSVGAVKRDVAENYVATQLGHHQMADLRVQQKLEKYQCRFPEIDLSKPRQSTHGWYLYNLHLVLVNTERWMEINDTDLSRTKSMVVKAASAKGHKLSALGILPDHIHLTIGCGMEESPGSVALSYMNNLSYLQQMRPILKFSYYVGTMGEYDLGAL